MDWSRKQQIRTGNPDVFYFGADKSGDHVASFKIHQIDRGNG